MLGQLPSLILLVARKLRFIHIYCVIYRINVLNTMLAKYPDLISCDEFVLLLQVLSEIQVECTDADARYHLYECLSTLVDVQKHLNSNNLDITAVDALWSIIWESTLRFVFYGLQKSVCI